MPHLTLYWRCQLAGWSFYGLLASGIPILYGGLRWMVLVRAVAGMVVGIGLTHRLRQYIRARAWCDLPLMALIPRILAASLIVSAVMWAMLLPLVVSILSSPQRAGPLTTIYSIHFIMVLGWMLLYFGYQYVRRIRSAEIEAWRAEVAMRDAELRALRAQLNPHFLFNSLNSLRGLILENPSKAQAAVTGLASLLRHTLRLSRARTTTLERELEAAEYYLELEAVRFEKRLRYEIRTDPEALEREIPPMLVQNLVENAIKYGISPRPDGGTVRILAAIESGHLRIVVRNTGSLDASFTGGGIGLSNSLERLRLIFGNRATLRLQQAGPDEVACEVVVPRISPTTHPLDPSSERGARALAPESERLDS